jgi:hypothetical protein
MALSCINGAIMIDHPERDAIVSILRGSFGWESQHGREALTNSIEIAADAIIAARAPSRSSAELLALADNLDQWVDAIREPNNANLTLIDIAILNGECVSDDMEKAAAAIRALAATPAMPAPAADRTTFTIPEGHEAIRNADGRASGETWPADAEPVAWRKRVNGAWRIKPINHVAADIWQKEWWQPLYARPALPVVAEVEKALEDIATTSKGYPNASREGQIAIAALAKLRAERGET